MSSDDFREHPRSIQSPGVDSPYSAPADGTLSNVSWDEYTPSGPQHRPWVRYWARTTEFMLVTILGGAVMGLVAPHWVETTPETLFGVIVLAAFRVYEAAMFSAFGTTPMKAFFRIRVRKADGRKLSFLEALGRSVKVWIIGEGLGIPLVSLITHITSYNRLTTRGSTSWDESGGFVVTHQVIDWWRWLIWLGMLVGIIGLMAFGSTV